MSKSRREFLSEISVGPLGMAAVFQAPQQESALSLLHI